jgi:hypothetical protein
LWSRQFRTAKWLPGLLKIIWPTKVQRFTVQGSKVQMIRGQNNPELRTQNL